MVRWWGRKDDAAQQAAPADVSAVTLELLTRQGCHLCEEAERVLRALCARRGCTMTRTDVDVLEAQQREQWTDLVPVVLVAGQEVCRWRVDVRAVEVALENAARAV